ncbi:nuclear transport factor 2 family protein [Sphingomonas mesophila]|uniref:nuclear transport factor 2 family protein n=1 Tax=Sphingomonas mesophila TaxID=2303576 RepID=UPI000E57180C|nr:nuclear transport factor 2 family protein [Sphingomonas mesophila]
MANLMPIIETLEARWMRAWASGDMKTLKALTARNFRLVMGSRPAAILDSPSWLEAARDRFLCDSYRFGDIYVRDVGSVAVFATQLTLRATMDGADWSGDYWVTDIWRKGRVRRQWRMVERILSRPDPDRKFATGIKSLQLWR